MRIMYKPVYAKEAEDSIFSRLRAEVKKTIILNNKFYRADVIKAVVYGCAYIAAYAGILMYGNNTFLLFLFYITAGISMILLFLNSFHDAAHGALFKNKKNNILFCYVLDLFGSNSYIWRKRHLLLHHAYPNVPNWDIDVKQSDIVRIFPNSKWLPMHKYQHIYMWFLYPLYTLNWFFIRDFKDFFGTRENYLKRIITIPKAEYYRLFTAKLFNIFYMVVVPVLILHQAWYIIFVAWISMHVLSSCLGTIALLSTHADEHAHFPETDEQGHLSNTWFMHQLDVTKDFSADSRVANFLFGGFTNHVAHHLFPGLAHTAYPPVTKIIRRYAKQYGLPYRCYPFYAAVRSHFRLLKQKGSEINLFKTGEL